MPTTYTFKCVFKKNNVAYNPDPAPTITIVSAGDVVLVNAAATTALTNLVGGYVYSYTGADDLDLIGKFLTSDVTIDEADLYSYTPAILTSGFPSILAAIAGIPAGVWAYMTRTLTMTPAQVSSALKGDGLTIHRGDTFEWTFGGLGSLAGRTSLYLTAKSDKSKPDSAAIIQVGESAGLLVLNGQQVDSGDSGGASLQVLDEAVGIVKLTIQASATFTFPGIRNNGYYDLQRGGTPVRTIREGGWVVEPDVTRRIA